MPSAAVCFQCCEGIFGIVDEVNNALQRIGLTESTVFLEDFNAHIEQTMKHEKV